MNWQRPSGTFDAIAPWGKQEIVKTQAVEPFVPDFADSDDLKKAFAIELAQGVNPFEAALHILDNDTSKALWASINWVSDIAVIGYRDAYLATIKTVEKPLDKEQILAKIKSFAEDKDIYGRFLVDAKERLNAWRLYSEISGHIGNKIDINSTSNNFTANVTKITLVKPDNTPAPKIIEASNTKSEISNDGVPVRLKLVGGTS